MERPDHCPSSRSMRAWNFFRARNSSMASVGLLQVLQPLLVLLADLQRVRTQRILYAPLGII